MGIISKRSTISLIFSFAIILNAQETGAISGYVSTAETDEYLENVQVFIENSSVGDITNENGQFNITGLNPGTYIVKATMMGYSPKTAKVSVESGSAAVVFFELQPTILEAEEIFVTATKMNKTVKNIGGLVYLVEAAELRKSDSRNIEDILTRVPGVFTEDKFHNEHNVVSFRGVGLHTYVTRGILVLVDGISVNEAMGRSVFEGLNLENAERVEILKGPVSALYGPNGITGVINIVTKKAPDYLTGSVNITGGSFDTKRMAGRVGTRFGRYGINANALAYSTKGYMVRNAYDTYKFNTRLSAEFEKIGLLDITFDYSESESDYPGPLTREQYENGEKAGANKYTGSDKQLVRFGIRNYKSLNERFNLISNLYHRSRSDLGHYRDTMFGDNGLNLIGGEVQLHSSRAKSKYEYVIGASHDQETGVSKTYQRDSDGIITDLIDDGISIYRISGLYAQTDLRMLSRLTVTLGVRYDLVGYDWQDNFLSDGNTSEQTEIGAISPKFGFAFNPFERVTLFGNWGRGFNPPEMSQLFTAGPTICNPDLKPEYLTNYELGVRGGLGYRINYQISAFSMDFTNQVVADEVTGIYANIGDTEHNGIETSISIMPGRNLLIYLNHSYLKTSFVDNPHYEGNCLRKTPENQFGTGLRLTLFKNLTWNLDYKWFDEYFMDNEEINKYSGYSIVNTRLRFEWNNYYSSLSVNNLFNKQYATWAYASYQSWTHSWAEKFYPGWPINLNLTIGINI